MNTWRDKHPCTDCGTGYGYCAGYALVSLMCCPDCKHPGRWTADPWTVDDLREMWEGKEMPFNVRKLVDAAGSKDVEP